MPDVPFCSYNQEGKKESFADWISDISPLVTPFTSMVKKTPVENVEFEWQTDSLSPLDLDNAFVEGAIAEAKELRPTYTFQNYTQIFRKAVTVSHTAGAVNSYGRDSEIKYQLEKASKEMKRDIEFTLLQENLLPFLGNSLTPSRTGSLGHFISDSLKKKIESPEGFEEGLFQLMEDLFTEGAEPTVLMYHPNLSYLVAGLKEKQKEGEEATRSHIFHNDTRFAKHVDTIVDPFGQEVACIPNIFVPQDAFYLLSPSFLEMAVLREPKVISLGTTGSAENWMIEQEIGLRVNNPSACAFGQVFLGPVLSRQTGGENIAVGAPLNIITRWSPDAKNYQWYVKEEEYEFNGVPVLGQITANLTKIAEEGDFSKYFYCRSYDEKGYFSESPPLQPTRAALRKRSVKTKEGEINA